MWVAPLSIIHLLENYLSNVRLKTKRDVPTYNICLWFTVNMQGPRVVNIVHEGSLESLTVTDR